MTAAGGIALHVHMMLHAPSCSSLQMICLHSIYVRTDSNGMETLQQPNSTNTITQVRCSNLAAACNGKIACQLAAVLSLTSQGTSRQSLVPLSLMVHAPSVTLDACQTHLGELPIGREQHVHSPALQPWRSGSGRPMEGADG